MMAAQLINRQWYLSTLLFQKVKVTPIQDRTISGITMDSRRVSSGSLFIACAGDTHHGLDFVLQALENGAVAILCEPGAYWPQAQIDALATEIAVPLFAMEGLSQQVSQIAARFYGEPGRDIKMIGVTGTNGKTSCSQYLAEALQNTMPCGIIGTLGSGFPGKLQAGTHTTPEPIELQSTLAGLREQGAQAVVMEVSSHGLDQGRTAAIHFDCAVLTNLSRDHLDFHGDMASYAAAKQRLFESPELRCAVLNLDEAFGWSLLETLPETVQAVAYGLSRPDGPLPSHVKGWVWGREIKPIQKGMHIQLESSWGAGAFDSKLLGRFNVSNLLAVLAVLLEQGMPMATALQRLSALHTVPGRMECFGGGDQPLVVVDYAHTPDALEQAITALRPHALGQLTCLFGCGGDRDQGKRSLMGAIAERLCDGVILTDDNPRSEDGDQIITGILSGMTHPNATHIQRNRAEAISGAIANAAAGDLVLVSGKGHETTQQCGDLCLYFSDREQVQKALARKVSR